MSDHKHEHDHEHCGCGKESCGCGHDHKHEHEHCGCGHDHKHEHEHCGCGHDHDHGHEHAHKHHEKGAHSHVYIMEGIDCANCAAKIEEAIRRMPEVTEANVTFATKQLRVTAPDFNGLLPKMQAVTDAVEDGVVLTERTKTAKAKSKVYILDGLDCANCAAKIESRLRTLNGVEELSITFSTKQMKVTAKDPDALLPLLKENIDALEDGITIHPKEMPMEKEVEDLDEGKHALAQIIIGAVLFAVGIAAEKLGAPRLLQILVLTAGYLILGGEVLLSAGKNILKGRVFDENFLMSIATLGAFAIGDMPEAVGVMLFYRVGEYFEDRAVEKSRAQIMGAVDMRPDTVNLVDGDDVRVIPAGDAEVGNILLVRPGDRIPLDGTVIEGESRIDTSPVTGEPVPVKAGAGDSVLSGCVNTSGQLKLRVDKPLEESMVTRILDSVENAAANKPAIDRFITRFARVYTPIVVGAAALIAFVLPFILPNWSMFVDAAYEGTATAVRAASGTASILTALTFLVISCPCALVLSVPLAFFSGIGAASKKGILFKGGSAIEALSAIKAVVMDKTGTVTQGTFSVQKLVCGAKGIDENALLGMAASAEMNSTHPIANSIVRAAKEKCLDPQRPASVREAAGHGVEAQTSYGTVLCGNRKLMEQSGIDMKGFVGEDYGTEVLVAVDGRFAGQIVIADAVKDGAAEAIARTKKMGVTTGMLTGDAEASARHVAKETGIDTVRAKLLPEDKVNALMDIRSQYGSVMFVGDGINDAPVLAGADVGAAMGSGADAAIEAADVVFMNSDVDSIPTAMTIARATRRIAWQNVYFALAVKVLVMVLGVLGHANMWLAVFADTGVSMLCLLNSIRILRMK